MDASPLSLDLHQVFSELRALGADDIELYAELRTTQDLDIWDRVHHARSMTDRGLSIFCRKGETSFHFCCNHWDTPSVLKLIAGKQLKEQQALSSISTAKMPPLTPVSGLSIAPRCVTVLNLARSAFAPASECSLFFEEESVQFWVCRSEEDGWTSGKQESVRIQARWKIEQEDGTAKAFTWERSGFAADAFVEALKSELLLTEAVRKSTNRASAWPAPQGAVPVFWSSQALAKITLPFLRAFEADLFLREASLLQHTSFPARWSFTLTDVPPQSEVTEAVDAEGMKLQPLLILKNGKPRGLACHRKAAAEMQVTGTGHSRRQDFRHLAVPGFWNVSIEWPQTEEDLLAHSPSGVWIEDVEILDSDPQTGIVCLMLRKAFLLHDKILGEPIENVLFEMPVQDFLATIEAASENQKTYGFDIIKEGQRLTTQLRLPDVYTPAFPFPGSVSSETYW